MIVRLWHGRTARKDCQEYSDAMLEKAVTAYESIEGNVGCYFLRRLTDDAAHFLLITHWDSMEAVKAFAGPNPEVAKYYPGDETYLLEMEESVDLYEVFYHAE